MNSHCITKSQNTYMNLRDKSIFHFDLIQYRNLISALKFIYNTEDMHCMQSLNNDPNRSKLIFDKLADQLPDNSNISDFGHFRAINSLSPGVINKYTGIHF